MSFTVIIPARYQASRFPGKLLANLGGKTILEHTWLRAKDSDASEVIIALDDERLEEAAQDFGAKTCMTSKELASGTDRVFEAARKCNCQGVIVNLQGDEPLFPSSDINSLASALLARHDYPMASMMQVFADEKDIDNPDMVKVVTDQNNRALYFSRAAIPFCRQAGQHFHHLGIYAYSVSFLESFVSWPVSDLEQAEQLEQLRVLSNGASILMVEARHEGGRGVDTPKDLVILEKVFAQTSRSQ